MYEKHKSFVSHFLEFWTFSLFFFWTKSSFKFRRYWSADALSLDLGEWWFRTAQAGRPYDVDGLRCIPVQLRILVSSRQMMLPGQSWTLGRWCWTMTCPEGRLPSRWLGVGATHRHGERTIQAAVSLQLERLGSVLRGTGPLNRRCHHCRGEAGERRPCWPRLVFRLTVSSALDRALCVAALSNQNR